MTNQQILEALLFPHEGEEPVDLPPAAREAFTEWYSQGLAHRGLLSKKQEMWLRGVAERRGLIGTEGQNLFSALPPKEQARQRQRAAAVKLPWEK